jgi:hypothetical protein
VYATRNDHAVIIRGGAHRHKRKSGSPSLPTGA